MHTKKTVLAIVALCLFSCLSFAQTNDGTWKYAFSQEGRQNWKPEFTLRYSAELLKAGPMATAGVRVDNKRTLGVFVGQGDIYIDAAPGDIYTISTGAYFRRYIHLGKKDIFALYGDVMLGGEYAYKVNGKYREYTDPDTGEHRTEEQIETSKGDIMPFAGIHAGLRLRVGGNFHIFLGPTLSTDTFGLHLGIGF